MCVVAGVPLTLSNVMREVREVEDWWGEYGLGDRLFIPETKREEIRQKFPDEMEQKKQLITYWINTDSLASWRRLIVALDVMEETKTADSIRSYAEPLTGMYCCNETTDIQTKTNYVLYRYAKINAIIHTHNVDKWFIFAEDLLLHLLCTGIGS